MGVGFSRVSLQGGAGPLSLPSEEGPWRARLHLPEHSQVRSGPWSWEPSRPASGRYGVVNSQQHHRQRRGAETEKQFRRSLPTRGRHSKQRGAREPAGGGTERFEKPALVSRSKQEQRRKEKEGCPQRSVRTGCDSRRQAGQRRKAASSQAHRAPGSAVLPEVGGPGPRLGTRPAPWSWAAQYARGQGLCERGWGGAGQAGQAPRQEMGKQH